MRPIYCLPVLACAIVGCLGSSVLSAAEFKLDGHTFTLPDGFTIERIAGPGLTDRPIHADFDEQGRLYVAESSGSNEPVQQQLEKKPHSILRLEDTNGDGVFDRRTVFADRMMFPEGVLWHDGSVYVTAPPEIWKLTDTNDDGVADQREVWFNPGTLTGCANDLHGPFLGRDGWIYWSKGAFAEQRLDLAEGGKLVTKAAHIFRRHPSGGGVEVVMSGGMDNPVEFVMTPAGDRFFTSTFMRHPGGGLRDGIGHASYGSLFGKDHDVLRDHPRTSATLSDPIVHLGPAAPAGLCYAESDAFGAEYRGNLYAALFNLQKVTRHVLTPQGASFRASVEDFLVSDQRDFHPTDVFEDADGSLIVIDTGGWYKICCPTSQLYKPDVLGAIYRIKKQGAHRLNDPRGLKLTWNGATPVQLAGRLKDARWHVRNRAGNQLAKLGGEATPALGEVLQQRGSSAARVAAIWTLARIADDGARARNREHLGDADPTVRKAAIYAAGFWRDSVAVPRLKALLSESTPVETIAAAAEALGRIRDRSAIPELVAALRIGPASKEALVRALIDIGSPEAIRTAVDAENASGISAGAVEQRHRDEALAMALDQLDAVRPEDVVPLLAADSVHVRGTGLWIVKRHPDWGPALTRTILRGDLNWNRDAAEVSAAVAQLASSKEVQQILADAARGIGFELPARMLALESMARWPEPGKAPAIWADAIADSFADFRQLAFFPIGAARGCQFKEEHPRLVAELEAAARDASLEPQIRLIALSALPPGRELDGALLDFVLGELRKEQSSLVSNKAVEALGRVSLTPGQRLTLAQTMKELGPIELLGCLRLFESGGDEPLGRALVDSLNQAKARASLQPQSLRTLLEKYPPAVRAAAKPLLTALEPDAESRLAKIDQLLKEVQEGDRYRGQAVFNSTKAACSSCHAIGYLGGDLGPDLTRIGQIRNERDLLEAIVYPSASFVRSYESVRVLTKDGEDHNGVVREDAADHLTLATGPGASVKVARSEIAEMQPGSLSIMPGGLDEQLSKHELADLLAFLKATRW